MFVVVATAGSGIEKIAICRRSHPLGCGRQKNDLEGSKPSSANENAGI